MPNPRGKSKSLRRRKKATIKMSADQVNRIGVNSEGQSIFMDSAKNAHLRKDKPKNKLGQ